MSLAGIGLPHMTPDHYSPGKPSAPVRDRLHGGQRTPAVEHDGSARRASLWMTEPETLDCRKPVELPHQRRVRPASVSMTSRKIPLPLIRDRSRAWQRL